ADEPPLRPGDDETVASPDDRGGQIAVAIGRRPPPALNAVQSQDTLGLLRGGLRYESIIDLHGM
ncbi:MAG: hypothetical protein KA419_21060, partial [Acidobacteria bacterium]|nr:hypothetical protein [Acidobacteriota bacterium]